MFYVFGYWDEWLLTLQDRTIARRVQMRGNQLPQARTRTDMMMERSKWPSQMGHVTEAVSTTIGWCPTSAMLGLYSMWVDKREKLCMRSGQLNITLTCDQVRLTMLACINQGNSYKWPFHYNMCSDQVKNWLMWSDQPNVTLTLKFNFLRSSHSKS